MSQEDGSGEWDICNESHVDDSLLGCKANVINPYIPSGTKTRESEHPAEMMRQLERVSSPKDEGMAS